MESFVEGELVLFIITVYIIFKNVIESFAEETKADIST